MNTHQFVLMAISAIIMCALILSLGSCCLRKRGKTHEILVLKLPEETIATETQQAHDKQNTGSITEREQPDLMKSAPPSHSINDLSSEQCEEKTPLKSVTYNSAFRSCQNVDQPIFMHSVKSESIQVLNRVLQQKVEEDGEMVAEYVENFKDKRSSHTISSQDTVDQRTYGAQRLMTPLLNMNEETRNYLVPLETPSPQVGRSQQQSRMLLQ